MIYCIIDDVKVMMIFLDEACSTVTAGCHRWTLARRCSPSRRICVFSPSLTRCERMVYNQSTVDSQVTQSSMPGDTIPPTGPSGAAQKNDVKVGIRLAGARVRGLGVAPR